MENLRKFIKETFARPDLPESRLKARDLLFFIPFIKPVWKLAAISLILAGLLTILKSVVPLGGKIFIDYIVLKQGYGQIESVLSFFGLQSITTQVIQLIGSIDVVVIAMIAAALVFGSMQMLQNYISMRFGHELTFNIQKSLFERVLRFPLSIFKTHQTGYLVSRISGDAYSLSGLFSGMIINLLSNSFFLVIGAAMMFLISPTITLLIICISPIYLAVNLYFSGRIRAVSSTEYENSSQVHKHMQEALSGVEVVKTNTTEEREAEKVSSKMRAVIQTRIKSSIIMSASGSIQQVIQYGIVILIMWLGAREMQYGTMTIGDFAAFSSYAYLLSGSINSLFYTVIGIQPTLASLDRLKEMFDIVPEDDMDKKNGSKIRPEKVEGNIRYENVNFAYEANKPVLKNVNFEIKAGETVTAIGPSGLGKTTIASLLLKFYSPQSGAIYLDGHDLRDIDTVWLRQQIAVVSQDIFLFDDTIENNIRYGRPAATHEEVIGAAKAANIHDSIVSFPEGYKTVVGERGAKLSTGQRQRISMARAFLRDAPILVLDEPTSALDMETEHILKESLRELVKGKTVLIISHRMSMTEVADRVLVVKDGKTTESETPQAHIKFDEFNDKIASAEQSN